MKVVFLLLAILAVSDASLSQQAVKLGDEVEVDFQGATAIKRHGAAGDQIFNFEGEHKGLFVDENGKEIDSSNYEGKDGILIIKKFTEADVGSYSQYPEQKIRKKNKNGGFSAVPGETLEIFIE